MKSVRVFLLAVAMMLSMTPQVGAATALMIYGDDFEYFQSHTGVPEAFRLELTEIDTPNLYFGVTNDQNVWVSFYEDVQKQLIAKLPDLEPYQIDLTQIVSRYISETEKNLENLFNRPDDAYGIFYFDDTDHLFGSDTRYSAGINVVPVPPTLILLGSALVLAGWRRLRKD